MLDRVTPSITICVPTYKRTTYLRQALRSCLQQRYKNYDILVSDDTQDDSIRSIVRSQKSDKIHYIKNTPPLGLNNKLQYFLDHAKGDWLVILCDDDLLDPEYLIVMARHISRFDDVTLVRCRYKLIDEKGQVIRMDRGANPVMKPFEFLSHIFLPEKHFFKMNISGILFPKLLLNSMGGFGRFHNSAHSDRLAWTLTGSMGTSIFEQRPLCSVRLHTASITGQLKADYEKAIGAELEFKKTGEAHLEAMAKKAATREDHAYLAQARERFKGYVHRHMSHSLDQGFMALLMKETDPRPTMKAILDKAKEADVPAFPSVYVYRLIAPLPLALRKIILKLFFLYKQKKLTS